MGAHRAEVVDARRDDPPYRACRNTSCWCWNPRQLGPHAFATGDVSHVNGGNPPPYTIIGRPPQ